MGTWIYLQISRQCEYEVRRVMHERAYGVDLDPQVEAGCLQELAELCSGKTGKSQVSI